jgi:signal transduction histidine kinase
MITIEALLNTIAHRPRYRLFILVCYMIWASVALRWITEYIEQRHPLTWLIIAMLLLYGLLLGLEPLITRGSTVRAHLYLAFQSGLVFVASLFFYELDYFAMLFIPLCGQAMFMFERPVAIRWLVIFILLTFVGQTIQFGGFSGLPYTFLYTAALIFIAAFSDVALKAEAARQKTEHLLHELQDAHRSLQAYAGQAEELAVANERNRMARDLHDSVAQTLYGLTLQAEAASRQLAAGELMVVDEYLHQIGQSAQQTLDETRLLIFELRPQILEQSGLAAALKARLEAVEARSRKEIIDRVEAVGRLPSQMENNLYRIALEALNNSLIHSQASQVRVTLSRQDGGLTLEVADNGIGFDPQMPIVQSGFGLSGMRERAEQIGAQLSIHSEAGQGVQVKVEVPV